DDSSAGACGVVARSSSPNPVAAREVRAMSDPTDPGGVGAAHAERTSRSPRVGDTGSPVGSPLTIILAVVAVVVGFLIFRTIDSSGGSALEVPPAQTTVPAAAGGTA